MVAVGVLRSAADSVRLGCGGAIGFGARDAPSAGDPDIAIPPRVEQTLPEPR